MSADDCEGATSTKPWTKQGRSKPSPVALRSLDEVASPDAPEDMLVLADWVRDYLMKPHPDLGRPGHVCPFTAKAVRLALLRIGVSPLRPTDRARILETMRDAMAAFQALPCTRATRIFRTVVVGFPNCVGREGTAALHGVQNDMRHHSIVQGKMIGLFEPESDAIGLVNPEFRPLRSPVPVLAIRMLVEQDAPFVVRNPILLPIYLLKFPLAGPRRLLVHAQATQRRAGAAVAAVGKRP